METPEEKRKREAEHKWVSIPSGRMGGKVNMKYKELMKEMKRFTGYDKGNDFDSQAVNIYKNNYSQYNAMPPYQNMPYKNYWDEGVGGAGGNGTSNTLVVFFGFNGMLSQKYSVVSGMSQEEITARLQFTGDKVPYSIKRYDDFMVVVEQMKDTPNMLSEITFDDALISLRVSIDRLQVVEFEDADEDEFDDNCVETCKPGMHQCSKK